MEHEECDIKTTNYFKLIDMTRIDNGIYTIFL